MPIKIDGNHDTPSNAVYNDITVSWKRVSNSPYKNWINCHRTRFYKMTSFQIIVQFPIFSLDFIFIILHIFFNQVPFNKEILEIINDEYVEVSAVFVLEAPVKSSS